MGSRHNRKRVRSRPRHRKSHQSLQDADNLPMILEDSPWNLPASLNNNQAWPSSPSSIVSSLHGDHVTTRHRPNYSTGYHHARNSSLMAPVSYEIEMEKARLHMYGGEEGDDSTLCAPMLQVVMDLFGGNVDYEDD